MPEELSKQNKGGKSELPDISHLLCKSFFFGIAFEGEGRFVSRECWNINAVFRSSICSIFLAYALFYLFRTQLFRLLLQKDL